MTGKFKEDRKMVSDGILKYTTDRRRQKMRKYVAEDPGPGVHLVGRKTNGRNHEGS